MSKLEKIKDSYLDIKLRELKKFFIQGKVNTIDIRIILKKRLKLQRMYWKI